VRLAWELESDLPVAVVRLDGHLNVASAPDARLALHEALAGQPSAVVVDLAGLTAVDDVILAVFGTFARNAATWPGCPVALCGPTAAVAAGLDRMSVDRFVEVYPGRAAALTALDAAPAPRRYWRRLVHSPDAAAPARATVAAACAAWGLEHLADRAELIVTELVGNAIVHAKTEMKLQVVLREQNLHITLADGSRDQPRLLPADPTAISGRGLILVDALSAGWGSTPTRDGKVVWAMLRV
jgi:anti-anti-sigma regulatory factor